MSPKMSILLQSGDAERIDRHIRCLIDVLQSVAGDDKEASPYQYARYLRKQLKKFSPVTGARRLCRALRSGPLAAAVPPVAATAINVNSAASARVRDMDLLPSPVAEEGRLVTSYRRREVRTAVAVRPWRSALIVTT